LEYSLDYKGVYIMTRDIENEVLLKQIKQLEKTSKDKTLLGIKKN